MSKTIYRDEEVERMRQEKVARENATADAMRRQAEAMESIAEHYPTLVQVVRDMRDTLAGVHGRLIAIDEGLARMQTLWATRQDEMNRQRQEALDREMERIRQLGRNDSSPIIKEGLLNPDEVEKAFDEALAQGPGGTA